MKSFSSFSFNDIPIDKSLDEIPGDLSYRYSDPCLLDRSDRDDIEEVVRKKDFHEHVSSFRSSESSVIETGNKHHHNISQVHSRSIDSWLKDHFEQEQINQKQNINAKSNKQLTENIKQNSKMMQKDKISIEGEKKEKKMGKTHHICF